MNVILEDIKTHETLEGLIRKTFEKLGLNAILETIDNAFTKVKNNEPFDTQDYYFKSQPDDIKNIINGTIDVGRLAKAMEYTHESYYWFIWVYYELFKTIKIDDYNSLELPDRTIEAMWEHPPTVRLSFDYLDHLRLCSRDRVTAANGFRACEPFIHDVDHHIKIYCVIRLHLELLDMLK
jgi:hypothetical protein